MTRTAPEGWGETEFNARLADIAAVKAREMPLATAQANAHQRRREAGLSQIEASAAVSGHARKVRQENARAEVAAAQAKAEA